MDYIDPEEEFEMMYADELEMMNEMEFKNEGNLRSLIKIIFKISIYKFNYKFSYIHIKYSNTDKRNNGKCNWRVTNKVLN